MGPALSRSLKRLNNIESDRCAQGAGIANGVGGLRAQRSILLKARKGERKKKKKSFDGKKGTFYYYNCTTWSIAYDVNAQSRKGKSGLIESVPPPPTLY